MKLTELLPQIDCVDFNISNEQEFATLSLCTKGNIPSLPCCVFLENKKFTKSIPDSASMVIVPTTFDGNLDSTQYGVCYADEPRKIFFKIHNFLAGDNLGYCRGKKDSTYGKECKVSPLSSIATSGVTLGNNVIIEEFVTIRENVTIGDNSIIRSGTVLGGQGFEFKRDHETLWHVSHLGGVLIGRDVEIQHNSCVSAAVFPWDNTEIGDFSKLGNLVQVGHGTKINTGVMIAVGATITGNCKIDENTWIGPGATVSNRLNIGKNAKVNIGAVVVTDIKDDDSVSGNFAIPHTDFMYNMIKAQRKPNQKRE